MTCWDILGIQPDADKKSIKIAYSKLLKITKPDDDPEGFQRLHSAYKLALDSINDPKGVAPESPENSLEGNLEDWAFDEPNISEQDSKSDELDNELNNEWHRFTNLVDEILENKETANKISAWENVTESSLVTDLEFNDLAGDYVFNAISEKNVVALTNDELFVQPNTLVHLNAYFSWDIKWAQLADKFDSNRLDSVLPYLDKSKDRYEDKKHRAPQEAQPHILSKLVSYSSSLLAMAAGYNDLNLYIAITILAIPTTINRMYTRKWQTKNYGRVIGAEDEQVEASRYILFPTLFIAMSVVLFGQYFIGWIIHYLIYR